MGEVKEVTPSMYKKLMRTSLVYDGRNIYSVDEMEQAEVEYHSIGRKTVERQNIKETNKRELQSTRH